MLAVLRSPVAWLVAACAVLLALALHFVTGVTNYWIQPDELTYVREAISIADGPTLLRKGDFWFNSYAQLWPGLLAPLYAAGSATRAFDLGHILQCLLFVSTAAPVFLLARRLTGRPWAAFVAALGTVLVPWIVMSGSLMTEPTAYAAFGWALLAMQRSLTMRSWRGDVVGLAGIALAFFARTQFAVLAVLLVAAAILHELAFADGTPVRERLRALVRTHALLLALAVLGLLGLAVGATQSTLGAYAATSEKSVLPPGTFAAGREMLAFAQLAVGVVPLSLATAFVVLSFLSPASRQHHAFAALSVMLVAGLTVVTGSFVRNFAADINDRYLLYLAPVLLVGTVCLLVDRRPAYVPLAVGALVGAVVLAATPVVPYPLSMQSPTRATHRVLDGRAQQIGSAFGIGDLSAEALLAGLNVLALGALVALRRRAPAWSLAAGGALVLALIGGQTLYALQQFGAAQRGASEAFVQGRNWVDRTLPSGARVDAVLGEVYDDPVATSQVWFETAGFNKAVDRTYIEPNTLTFGHNMSRVYRIDDRGRLRDIAPRPYLALSATEHRFALSGLRRVHSENGVDLMRVTGPLRTPWSLEVTTSGGRLAVRQRGRLRVYPRGARAQRRTVTLTVTTSPGAPRGYDLRIRPPGGAERRVQIVIGTTRRIRVPVTVPAGRPADLGLAVSEQLPGPSPDLNAGLVVKQVRLSAARAARG